MRHCLQKDVALAIGMERTSFSPNKMNGLRSFSAKDYQGRRSPTSSNTSVDYLMGRTLSTRGRWTSQAEGWRHEGERPVLGGQELDLFINLREEGRPLLYWAEIVRGRRAYPACGCATLPRNGGRRRDRPYCLSSWGRRSWRRRSTPGATGSARKPKDMRALRREASPRPPR